MAGAVTYTDKLGESFVLRPYRETDRPCLEAMYDAFEPKRVAQGLPPSDRHQRTRWLASVLSGGHHLIATIEDRIVGHGMLLPFGEGEAELANFLHQSARDRGIGTIMNGALLDLGRGLGMHRVWLSVEPFNRRAIRSYEKAGFRRRALSPWMPEIEMEVVLDDHG